MVLASEVPRSRLRSIVSQSLAAVGVQSANDHGAGGFLTGVCSDVVNTTGHNTCTSVLLNLNLKELLS